MKSFSQNRAGWAVAACVVAILALLGVTSRQLWVARRQAAENAALGRENAALRARLASRPPVESPPPAHPEPAAPSEPRERRSGAPAANPAEEQAVADLKARLAETNALVSQLEAQLQDLRVESQKLGVDNKRLSDSEADLKDDLSAANRAIEAQQRELKGKADRIVQLELANQKLRDQTGANSQKLAQSAQLTAELQDVDRRRLNVLNAILRRYRDITDQYRGITAMADRRQAADPAPAGTDLSRIQNAISLAEDDLRQLDNLNAQAARIQKQLSK
jgi:regulator of replication initiation timing